MSFRGSLAKSVECPTLPEHMYICVHVCMYGCIRAFIFVCVPVCGDWV